MILIGVETLPGQPEIVKVARNGCWYLASMKLESISGMVKECATPACCSPIYGAMVHFCLVYEQCLWLEVRL
jgi:hypothetical protein